MQLHGIRAHAFQADLGDYDSVRALHAAVVDTLGNPDILFNNAGTTGTVVGRRGDIENVTLEDFEQTWKINTGSSFLVGRSVLFMPPPQVLFLADATVYPSYGVAKLWSRRFLLKVSDQHCIGSEVYRDNAQRGRGQVIQYFTQTVSYFSRVVQASAAWLAHITLPLTRPYMGLCTGLPHATRKTEL
jgi:NAD(P)-dependent dehydrogenase (short-subunit alcohol dehydrogenase family)